MSEAALESSFYERAARHARLPFVELDPRSAARDPVDPAAARLLTPWAASALRLVPVAADAARIVVAVSDPRAEETMSIVAALTGRAPEAVLASPAAIRRAQGRVYGEQAAAAAASATAARGEQVRAYREALPEPVAPAAVVPAARPHLLGDLLLATGLITRAQLVAALRIQERTGDRLGRILVHAGLLDEDELAGALAAQLRLPLVDVARYEPDRAALRLVPEAVARRHRFVPLAVSDHVLYVAATELLSADAVAELHRHTSLPLRVVIGSARAIEDLFARAYQAQRIEIATTELLNRIPEESAYRTLVRPQKLGLVAVVLGFAALLLRYPIDTIIGFNIASIVFYTAVSLYKFRLIYSALEHQLELPISSEELAQLDERDLPVYSILVPLYHETAVADRIVRALDRLDYPRTKLDIKLIVEEDDLETQRILQSADLPPHFKLVVVPDRLPKTKPKACNYGLLLAEGRYVVIYDAEDRPEPDQLKKIVIAFSKAEDRIACVQCKLNYYNYSQNVLTRWFTTEYANWFDLLMPGLDAADDPIPLGGTSNHFIRERLIELGAWDPFNVTEDADLGIRLHRAGYKTAIIDSTTFEEANSDLRNWIRQRSRWVKGYIQTWLVHMRHPVRLQRQIGWRSFLSFQLIVGGTFASFLLNPLYWFLTTLWIATHAGVIRQLFPGPVYYSAAVGLYVGNFVFTYINVAGSLRRGYYDLVKYALLSPLYWALMSIGAYKGLFQLVYRPHYWEKTIHGLDTDADAAAAGVLPS